MRSRTCSGSVGDVVAGDDGPARRSGASSVQSIAHGGGLAGAVRAEEAVDLARLDVEVDAVDGGEVAEAALEALHRDGGRGRVDSDVIHGGHSAGVYRSPSGRFDEKPGLPPSGWWSVVHWTDRRPGTHRPAAQTPGAVPSGVEVGDDLGEVTGVRAPGCSRG